MSFQAINWELRLTTNAVNQRKAEGKVGSLSHWYTGQGTGGDDSHIVINKLVVIPKQSFWRWDLYKYFNALNCSFYYHILVTLNGVCEGISEITLSFVNLSVCFLLLCQDLTLSKTNRKYVNKDLVSSTRCWNRSGAKRLGCLNLTDRREHPQNCHYGIFSGCSRYCGTKRVARSFHVWFCMIFCSSEAVSCFLRYGRAAKTLRGTRSAMLLAMPQLFTLDHLGCAENILIAWAGFPALLPCFKSCCHMLKCIIEAAPTA